MNILVNPKDKAIRKKCKALYPSQWFVMRVIYRNQTNGFCSISLIEKNVDTQEAEIRRHVGQLARHGFLEGGKKDILKISEYGKNVRAVRVIGQKTEYVFKTTD